MDKYVINQDLQVGDSFVFIAAEFSAVKTIRKFLKLKKGLSPGNYSATAYWTVGASEDKSVDIRRRERHN